MKNKILVTFLITNLIFIACNSKVKNQNSNPETEEMIENRSEKIDSLGVFDQVWQRLPYRNAPLIDSTNFDNIKKVKEFNTEEIIILQLSEIYPNSKKEKTGYKFQPAYKLKKSDNFYTLVLNVFKGDHELESVLINYDLEKKLIAYKIIAYDEIAEGWSRKFSKIEKSSITIIDEFYSDTKQVDTTKFHINRFGYLNPINTKFTSDIRPNKPILLNKIYTDTIQFSAYNDEGDYYLMFGKKNKKDISLVYNWEWNDTNKYNFKKGDVIKITWKMDSIFIAGDGETLDFSESALDAEKISDLPFRMK